MCIWVALFLEVVYVGVAFVQTWRDEQQQQQTRLSFVLMVSYCVVNFRGSKRMLHNVFITQKSS